MYFQITECKRLNNYKILNIKIINDCLSISRKEESHKYLVHGLTRRMSQWVKSITIMPKDESSNPGSHGGKRDLTPASFLLLGTHMLCHVCLPKINKM